MTQALAGFNDHGLVLATDSRATRLDAAGRLEYFSVGKLFPLGTCCAVLSGGAGVSVPLSLALRREIEQRWGLIEFDDLVGFAQSFLSLAYTRHLRQQGPEPEGFRRLYFILAGHSPQAPPPGYRLTLLGSEENELPLRLIPVGNLVVMPRNLGMEMRLFKALREGAPLTELLKMSKDFLEKMAAIKEEVGPPYYFATITPAGYEAVAV
jgi:hypothetical protein